ncbi:MAG: efflux RND transporter periplasmic adaptor subunit [Steroidobacteraceae bacterium]|nr:efflux RND transporter periplasmic adaptor subunit [Steroidobacteraceae bacterium]
MTIGKRGLVVVAALGALAGAIGWWSAGRGDHPIEAAPAGERKVLYWYDPMVPDQHFSGPGKSPFMDMPLQPRYADEEAKAGVEVSPVTQRSLGVRTVAVEKGRLGSELAVPGTIAWDLRLERVVSARTGIIVDRLHVKAPFARVRQGEPLASVIAPAWSAALAETQAIAQSAEAGTRELEAAARARLRALGVPSGTQPGRDGRILLTAPGEGVVSEIGVREGEAAPVGTTLFRINGTRTVWLQAAVPQADAAGIAAGVHVVAEVGGVANPVEGRVESLLPALDPASRTRQARIVLANPDGLLAAGQQARVSLRADAGPESLLVPSDAVIGSGERAHVIVRHGEAHFMPMAVRTGRSSGGRTEVLSGLQQGEQVVVSGQFLLDSEASLAGALERLGGHGAHP